MSYRKMLFSDFVLFLEKLDQTSSRIEITKLLSELFEKLSEVEIQQASYLLVGAVAPFYKAEVFNIADKMMERAIAMAFDEELSVVSADRKKSGDLGTTSFNFSDKHKKNKDISLIEVYDRLVEITQTEGEGSQDKRTAQISDLLKELSPLSAKYVTRIILGKTRLGFSEKTMIDALSWMETGGKSQSAKILKAYEVVPDIGLLAKNIKSEGIQKATAHVSPIVGIPVEPMLCQRLKSPTEMISKMGSVGVEPKFDGLRVLIHWSEKKGILKAFTRNLKDISEMFPELTSIKKHVHANELILDSEAVGMDQSLMKILDFQTTMKRRRKHDIEELQNKIPVTFQVFDIILKDGENLMDKGYKVRRKILSETIHGNGLLKVDKHIETDDPALITKLHKEYRGQGLEGIIVKKLDSEYVPGRLGWRWVKMKEAEEATGKLPDTVDAIIMGYTQGSGKRAKFGIGQFLAGILDNDQIKTITKVGTGLTDDQFKELEKSLKPLITTEKPKEYEVHKDLTPDFWVEPRLVVELAADDLTVSPKHTAGYAMRFPRLVKVREDKPTREATTLTEIKKLFKLQNK